MHRGRTTAVGLTAKHDAVGANQRGECAPLRSVTMSTAWPARSAGLWAIRRITRIPAAHRSGRIQQRARKVLRAWCTGTRPRSNSPWAVVAAAYIRRDSHIRAQTIAPVHAR